MSKNSKKQTQSGLSLLELLLVVGVGAVLVLAGIATYRLVTRGSNVNEAISLLTTVKQQTQRAFQGQSTYSTADVTPTLVAMQAFPSGVVDGAGTPQHPWNGDIVVTGATRNFTVAFSGVPTDACIQLGTTFDAEDSDFVSLVIGTGTPIASLTPAAMTTACSVSAEVDMTWTFF